MRHALIEAWDTYEPRDFGGVITLIRSQDNIDDRAKDWQVESLGRVTGARVATKAVPGGHFALLREPNVRTAAELIMAGMV
jgi:thioesterase domain-containing protein